MQPSQNFPIRFAVCDTADEVRAIIKDLRLEGFTADEISVVCSQESCEREFEEFVHEHPAGSQIGTALNRSGVAALGLGAAAIIAGLLTSAGAAIVAIGAFAGVAIAGTFTAMMMTRGAEKELADYYDQAITYGKILVAVATYDESRQQRADAILNREGTQPSALPSESAPAE